VIYIANETIESNARISHYLVNVRMVISKSTWYYGEMTPMRISKAQETLRENSEHILFTPNHTFTDMQLISSEKVYSSRHSIPRQGKPPLLSKVESLNLIVEMSMDSLNNFLKGFRYCRRKPLFRDCDRKLPFEL